MTTSIRQGATFFGHPVTKLRTVLTSWAKGKRNPARLAYLKSVSLSPASVLALLGEAYDRGLIQTSIPGRRDQEVHKVCQLSDAGRAVTSASALKRSSKVVAKRVLDKILENAEALAADPNALYCADQIWVFGSYIDTAKSDVGDLDIVVMQTRTATGEKMNYEQKNDHIDLHYPGVVPEGVYVFWRQDHWFNKMIYGARRHHLVSENTMDTLIDLHVPCALVFDRSRGGIIEPEYYEHHPESTGRSSEIRERLVMPDLDKTSNEFRFVSAEFYTRLFTGRNWDEHTVIVDKVHLSKSVQRNLENIPIDGREHFAILIETGRQMQALLHIQRRVVFDGSTWTYDMTVKCLYEAKNADYNGFGKYFGGDLLWTLFNADIVRLAARRAQLGGYQDINASMTMCHRSASIPSITEEIEWLHERWFFDRTDNPNLPEDQRFGVFISYNEGGGGYSELFFFDEEDWAATSVVDRDTYSMWLASVDPVRYGDFLKYHQGSSLGM